MNAKDVNYEDRGKFSGAQVIGGAIFNTKLDKSHPINFGIKSNYLPTFRNNTIFMKPDKNSFNNPIKYTSNPLLSGYISKENTELLKRVFPLKLRDMVLVKYFYSVITQTLGHFGMVQIDF